MVFLDKFWCTVSRRPFLELWITLWYWCAMRLRETHWNDWNKYNICPKILIIHHNKYGVLWPVSIPCFKYDFRTNVLVLLQCASKWLLPLRSGYNPGEDLLSGWGGTKTGNFFLRLLTNCDWDSDTKRMVVTSTANRNHLIFTVCVSKSAAVN